MAPDTNRRITEKIEKLPAVSGGGMRDRHGNRQITREEATSGKSSIGAKKPGGSDPVRLNASSLYKVKAIKI